MSEKYAADDKLMAQIVSKANVLTNGKYAAIYTADSPVDGKDQLGFAAVAKEQVLLSIKSMSKQDSSSSSSSSSSDPLYITPAILTGLLVSLFLILISACGITGLMSLETPNSFEGEGGYLAGN